MADDRKSSRMSWFLPLLAGALLTGVANQVTLYFQEKDKRRDEHIRRAIDNYEHISEQTSELYYVTKNLIGELQKPDSYQIEVLKAEYRGMLENLNINFLKDYSLIKYHISPEMANTYENKIVRPLMRYNKVIEPAIFDSESIDIDTIRFDELGEIKMEIIRFNEHFIEHIEELSRGK